jgi:hypothetical protein
MSVSDFQINARVRSVLAKHWIDTQRVKFGSFKGTVRFSGQIHPLGDRSATHLDGSKLEIIESELKRIRGVLRVFFDLANWRKSETGKWICQDKAVTHSLQSDHHVVLQVNDSKPETPHSKGTEIKTTGKK